jgi:hypothetical protein
MTENTITDEQRKAFAELIKQSQTRFEDRYNGYLKSLKDEWAPKLDDRSKVRRFTEEIRNLRSKLSDAADNLRRMGFRVVDDGFISVDHDVTNNARRELDENIRSAEAERDQEEAKFRKAYFNVWSAQSVDEAKEIVSRLLNS